VEVAIDILRSEFPKLEKAGTSPPVILKNQIYALVTNRTDVDREIVCA
jgi:hypothetical protein